MSRPFFLSQDEIKALLLDPRPPSAAREIAREMGLSVMTISNYKHLVPKKAREMADELRRLGLSPVLWPVGGLHGRKLTDADAAEIRALRHLTSPYLARRYGVAKSTIRMIWAGRTYPVSETEN